MVHKLKPMITRLKTDSTATRIVFTVLKYVGWFLFGITCLAVGFWCCLAIYFSNLPWPWLRTLAAYSFPVIPLALIIICRKKPYYLLISVSSLYALIIVWYLLIPASNDRNWLPEYGRTAYATVEGNKVTIHNIRNFDYRSETDYTVRYYDKTFDMNKLDTVNFITVYWGNQSVAHTMLSFGFGGKDYVCISVETRREKGEPQTGLRGLFKQYELIYIVADEKDLIRLRTNFRKEDVYLYPTTSSPEDVKILFKTLFAKINKLHDKPTFYNTILHNCTTTLAPSVQKVRPPRPFDIRLLINGYIDEMAYQNGWIKPLYKPFAEMKEKSYVNPLVENDPDPTNFSQKIRRQPSH